MTFKRSPGTRTRFLLTALILKVFPYSLLAGITFSFSEEVQYFQVPIPDPDLLIGDTFTGTFTFEPSVASVPITGDASLSVRYPSAITSWNVTFPRLGRSFSGTSGEIAIGNDSPGFYLSDRYVVTLFTQGTANPIFPSGRTLRFVQLDLFDVESVSNPRPADLLANILIPTTPPDLNRISNLTQGSATGHVRFNENNNQVQTRLTTLQAIPEPGNALFGLMLLATCWLRRRETPLTRIYSPGSQVIRDPSKTGE